MTDQTGRPEQELNGAQAQKRLLIRTAVDASRHQLFYAKCNNARMIPTTSGSGSVPVTTPGGGVVVVGGGGGGVADCAKTRPVGAVSSKSAMANVSVRVAFLIIESSPFEL
jgi:hypothetical protein